MQNLIPKPVSVKPGEGFFEITAESQIQVDPASNEMLAIGQFLANSLKPATGFGIPVKVGKGSVPLGNIYLTTLGADPALGKEGYELHVVPGRVRLAAPQLTGLFRGIQTIRQLLPVPIEKTEKQPGPWRIPAGTIRDWPRYAYRGAMLDVARHFFGVADIKRYIDLLVLYKLNALHLHLTDDQGWRIEIKSWPNLTEHGSTTAVNNDPGGFYTQEQYAEIVAYAQNRHILIVPEIDLPGHTNAALASYPELNCDDQAPALYSGTEVGFSSLCIHKEITYQFVEDVIHEVAKLTPGPYIHIGGDEAKSTPKDDYKYFVERIEPLVAKYGKEMVGWEEIVECNLSPTSIMQYWTDIRHAEMAVAKNVQLIMSPAPRTYIDMKYDKSTPLGLDWAGTMSVEKAYTWDPLTEVQGLEESAIVGIEAPLWAETLRTMKDVEFMAFPRLAGIAEIGWSKVEGRSWDEYRLRLAAQSPCWTAMGVNFYRAPEIPWK
jgi:hexosaminidase